MPSSSSILKLPSYCLWCHSNRQRKRHTTSEFMLLQTSPLLIHLVQFAKCWRIFLGLKSKALYRSSEKKSFSLVQVFRHKRSTNSMAKKRKKKKTVMQVQSFRFANLRGCFHEGRKIRPSIRKMLEGKIAFRWVNM